MTTLTFDGAITFDTATRTWTDPATGIKRDDFATWQDLEAPRRLVASASACTCEEGGVVRLEEMVSTPGRVRLRCPRCGLRTPWRNRGQEEMLAEDWVLGRLLTTSTNA